MKKRHLFYCIAYCMVALFSGCGSPQSTGPNAGPQVYGAIMLNNALLNTGTIVFDDPAGGRTYETSIKDGRYKVNLPPGEKIVRITSEERNVPTAYNVDSKVVFVVPEKGGPKDFEF